MNASKLFCLFAVMITAVSAEPRIGGMVRNYTALRLQDDNDFSMLQNTFKLSFEQRGDKAAFNSVVYAYQYGKEYSPEINIQQLYLEVYLKNVDFQLGRQQIIWGKADGVFITDVVSPKDLREFLLPDFNEIRQGVDALTTSYYLGSHTFSLVLSPVFRPTIQPGSSSIWKPALPAPRGVDVKVDTTKKDIPVRAQNSEAFLRWSAMFSALDFELTGAWMWDDDPTLHTAKFGHVESGKFHLDSMRITPQHHRLIMGGGSLSTTVRGVVVKGEAAHYSGKMFRSTNPVISDGIVEGDYVHYLLGASYSVYGVDFSAQFIQKYLYEHDDFYVEDKVQNMATVLIHRSFLRETLSFELFSYIGLNDKDALIRPIVSYDITDGMKATVGVNIFTGDTGYFGQFNENDMLYLKLSYSF